MRPHPHRTQRMRDGDSGGMGDGERQPHPPSNPREDWSRGVGLEESALELILRFALRTLPHAASRGLISPGLEVCFPSVCI